MSPKFNTDNIRVDQIKCYYDPKTSTKVTEKPYLVQYESQHFKCKALVELEESIADSHWTIGLIQACDRMYLENRYGQYGSSFWEFHPLKTRQHRMVNDSDGRQYPFYSLTSSKCEVTKGVVRDSVIKLQYADHFYPTVAWDLPYCNGVKLTDVIRRQSFWIWLVAIKRAALHADTDVFHLGDDQIHILSSMHWRYSLHMEFDPHERIGRRLRTLTDTQMEAPRILPEEEVKPMPLSAVHPPHCNAAQSLIWYPKQPGQQPDILVPPKQTIVPWERWLRDMMPGVAPNRVHRPKDLHLCPSWRNDRDIGRYCSWDGGARLRRYQSSQGVQQQQQAPIASSNKTTSLLGHREHHRHGRRLAWRQDSNGVADVELKRRYSEVDRQH
ncbi:hypothetical protein BOX15_Mlig007864g1 [Macrostomum lignano]|uniref:Uncharacterized protein n=2 Tax=Macrostomum lignano TaxID=282301 RepID=A0A267DEC0_9PLAT|nr:hypothetical protein BOX15_Mlig007864g2 [Macrostomum lignano]PAA75272.1 hypothetical protein BOX15_Mlig007864g3 [Macrostomum lignano]PAA90104.1 hypothetical protein BOX15_Mlig007864g1 [Macrostomum lignano]